MGVWARWEAVERCGGAHQGGTARFMFYRGRVQPAPAGQQPLVFFFFFNVIIKYIKKGILLLIHINCMLFLYGAQDSSSSLRVAQAKPKVWAPTFQRMHYFLFSSGVLYPPGSTGWHFGLNVLMLLWGQAV